MVRNSSGGNRPASAKKRIIRRIKKSGSAYLPLLPVLVLIGLFYVVPIIQNVMFPSQTTASSILKIIRPLALTII